MGNEDVVRMGRVNMGAGFLLENMKRRDQGIVGGFDLSEIRPESLH
jgi:hypothetical protein